MMLLQCKTCKELLPDENFYANKKTKSGKQYHCKQCSHINLKEWRKKNPEKLSAINRRKYQKNKEKLKEAAKGRYENYRQDPAFKERYRKQRIKSVYGMTWETYCGWVAWQGNRCAICRVEFDREDWKRRPNVDHCHETGRVRGVLCNKCNIGLGAFNDQAEHLLNAERYLRGLR
jgi:hypothetical protein